MFTLCESVYDEDLDAIDGRSENILDRGVTIADNRRSAGGTSENSIEEFALTRKDLLAYKVVLN